MKKLLIPAAALVAATSLSGLAGCSSTKATETNTPAPATSATASSSASASASSSASASASKSASASASSSSAPNADLQTATGTGYSLQVPTAWKAQENTGTSVGSDIAYYSDPAASSTGMATGLNVVTAPAGDVGGDLAAFTDHAMSAAQQHGAVDPKKIGTTTMGGDPAITYSVGYKNDQSNEAYRLLQTLCVHNGKTYVVSYTDPSTDDDQAKKAALEKILSTWKWA